MLVTLLLYNVVLVDVSSPVSFPCLKELRLVNIKFPGDDESVSRLLSNDDNVTIFTVRVPSLKNLHLCDSAFKE
ncbi:unnamed protein product [Brassica rapa subsp. narinosa]